MKIGVLIVFMITCLPVLSVVAQKNDKRYHLYGTEKSYVFKLYGGPLVAFSQVEGKPSFDVGATAGMIFNKYFLIGIYGQSLAKMTMRNDLVTIGYPTYNNGEIKMMQGGLLLGFVYKPAEIIHFGASSSMGAGTLKLFANNPAKDNPVRIYRDRVYFVTPKFFAEVNMNNFLKVNLSAGYRFIGKINTVYIDKFGTAIPIFNKSDYNQPQFSISLLFGAFNKYKGIMNRHR